MAMAVILIICNIIHLYPSSIGGDEDAFIFRDIGKIIDTISIFISKYDINMISYIILWVVFSKYLQYFEIPQARIAIVLMLFATAIPYVIDIAGLILGLDPLYDYTYAVISETAYNMYLFIHSCIFIYLAALFFTYKGIIAKQLKMLAILFMISIGLFASNFLLILPEYILNVSDFSYYDYFTLENTLFKIIQIAGFIFTIAEYYIFYRIFDQARTKSGQI